jgi:ATP-binding cassette subfamily C (CFTR/MRP) protein 1
LIIADLFGSAEQSKTQKEQDDFQVRWSLSKNMTSRSRFLGVMFMTIRPHFLRPVLPKLCLIATTLAQALLLPRVLSFIQDKQQPAIIGYTLIGASLLVYALLAVFKAYYEHLVNKLVTAVRGLAINVLYTKVISLGSCDIDKGTLTTLVNTDIENIMLGLRSFHDIWAGTIVLGVSLWLLHNQLGYAILGPLIVALLLTLLTALTGPAVGRAQETWLTATETRARATIAVLSNMKAFKMLGFVENIAADIQDLRVTEVRKSRAFRFLISASITISSTIPQCANMVAFVIFAIVSQLQGRDLDVTNLFASLALIGVAVDPIGVLIQAIPELVSARTSLFRIQSFLLQEELGRLDVVTDNDSGNSRSDENTLGQDKQLVSANEIQQLVTESSPIKVASHHRAGRLGQIDSTGISKHGNPQNIWRVHPFESAESIM